MTSAPATAGSGASVLEMLRIGSDVTVVVIAAPATGAVSLQSIEYEPLVMSVPLGSGLLTWTVICTVPDAPAPSAPMFQVTTPAASEPPAVADTKVTLAGTVSVMTTPVASSLPVLEYERVYVTLLPAVADTNVVFAGIVSVITTPVALALPLSE